jgi:hypothetical protein
VTKWYQLGTGYPAALSALKDFITNNFIPSLKVLSAHSGSCVTAQVIQRLNNSLFNTIRNIFQ